MKAKDLRERSIEDLRELEKSLAKDTFQARFKNFTNRLDDTSTIGKARRDLARVKTLLRELELNAATKAAGEGEAKPAPKRVGGPKRSVKSPAKEASTKTTAASKKSE